MTLCILVFIVDTFSIRKELTSVVVVVLVVQGGSSARAVLTSDTLQTPFYGTHPNDFGIRKDSLEWQWQQCQQSNWMALELREGCVMTLSVEVVVLKKSTRGRLYPMKLCILVFIVHTPSTSASDRNELTSQEQQYEQSKGVVQERSEGAVLPSNTSQTSFYSTHPNHVRGLQSRVVDQELSEGGITP